MTSTHKGGVGVGGSTETSDSGLILQSNSGSCSEAKILGVSTASLFCNMQLYVTHYLLRL
jgi:hypothetical protein